LDGRVWLLGDVRLDGREELRRELEHHDEPIAANATDEALILRAWRQWGEAGLAKLLGDFSFAIWDETARQLWGVRDLIGARPFFYARAGGRFYFSNTLDAIRCATEISRDLDYHFIGDFLLEGWCPDLTRTAFRELSRLPAGHILRFSSEVLEVRRFVSLPIEEPLWLKREEEYVERFRELFEQAVRERLPGGPVGIYLSGGLDSTSVAAVATDTAKRNGIPLALRAYTVDCRPVFDDKEGLLASLTAEKIGIPIEFQSGTSCLPYEDWNEPRLHMPEPFHDIYRSLCLRQAAQVSLHARVALNGYGGDGIMTGQGWPYLVYLLRRMRFGTIGKSFGGYFLKHGRIPALRGGFRSTFRRWLGKRDPAWEYPMWLTPKFEQEVNLRARWQDRRRTQKKLHPYYPDAYGSLNRGYWASVLESDDSGWTGVALESRQPLLDLRLVQFLLRVPPVPLCMDKELLRRTVCGLLPEEVRLRSKTPFDGDLLALQVRTGQWQPLPLPEPRGQIGSFVDWGRLGSSIKRGQSSLWSELRPISLLHWLKGIETDEKLR
jgi:asparagine synthase (glutamine-hydrolysing)